MPTRVTHDLTYDAPLAAVSAMLGDRSFREEVCVRSHVLRHRVTVVPPAASHAGPDVTIDQVQSSDGLPGFARKIVGDEIEIVQRETWTTPTEAEVHVSIPGKPGEMEGTARLTESDGTTTESVDLEIRVRIPIVGGKIERLVADMLLKSLRTENTVGREYLAR